MDTILEQITRYIDFFCRQENIHRLSAIVGGTAIVLHGIPRVTFDDDILLIFTDQEGNYIPDFLKILDIQTEFSIIFRLEVIK